MSEILAYPLNKKKYNLIISLHPLDDTIVPGEYTINKKYSSFDLIKIADYIITDYSVLSIEASILKKPIFLLLSDMEEYIENRGINIDLEKELPSFVCKRFTQIMDKIEKKEYNITELIDYRNKYVEVDTNSSIKNIIKFVLAQDEERN